MSDRDIRDLTYAVDCLTVALDTAQARADAIVRWQDVTLEYGDHPDVTTADLSPDAGLEPCGPWQPYAAVSVARVNEQYRVAGLVDCRCWRRPLRRVE